MVATKRKAAAALPKTGRSSKLPRAWDKDDVAAFVEKLSEAESWDNGSEIVKAIISNDVNGRAFKMLDNSDMSDLGVKKIGQRKALIAARDKLFEDECSDKPLPSAWKVIPGHKGEDQPPALKIIPGHKAKELYDAAASYDMMAEVLSLLQEGADPNGYEDPSGNTALIKASMNGDARGSTVELLLKHGANVEAKEADGSTALMVASGFGHADLVEVLLKHGASKSPKLKFDGKTALDLARLRHSGNQRLLDLLA